MSNVPTKVMYSDGLKCSFEKLPKNRFEFVVQTEFFSNINIEETILFNLIKDHNLFKFIYNDQGPAFKQDINNDKVPSEFHWMNRPLTDEEIEKIKHNVKFNNDVQTIVTSKD